MGWWRPYEYRFWVEWPYYAGYPDEPVELDWRVQLAAVLVSLVITGLALALGAWLGS